MMVSRQGVRLQFVLQKQIRSRESKTDEESSRLVPVIINELYTSFLIAGKSSRGTTQRTKEVETRSTLNLFLLKEHRSIGIS